MGDKQTVAVIGSGAVGCYYGARLAEAGHRVTFLARRDFAAIRNSGLQIRSPDGDLKLTNPAVVKKSDEIGPVDWVICALKATSIGEARKLVAPCIGASTRVLVLMNGLGLEELFAAWFGAERVFGGLAFTCINRGDPGQVHHLAYGGITIGHFQDEPAQVKDAIALWAGAKVRVVPAPSLLHGRWEKLCWNIPFSGLCVAAGGVTTEVIMCAPGLQRSARVLMNEVISTGNADLADHGEQARIAREPMLERMFKNTGTMGPYRPSAMIDFVAGKPMEIEAIFGEPLRRAVSLGVPAPQLELLTALLRMLNLGRK